MSVNSDSNTPVDSQPRRKWRMLLIIPAWVFVSFVIANVIIGVGIAILSATSIYKPVETDAVFNTVLAALIYALTLAITIGVPKLLKKRVTSKKELGLARLPNWMDILLAPAAAAVYLLLSALLVVATSALIPGIDLQQSQDVGFQDLSTYPQYLLAFLTLVVIAPIAEETLFRGYLYGKLRKYVPLWVAMLTTSLLFGLAHGQWNVAIDVFALSLVLCTLREITGSIWAGVLLHMLKNGFAFYLLFINPSLLTTIGG